jgi:hypothetical protein
MTSSVTCACTTVWYLHPKTLSSYEGLHVAWCAGGLIRQRLHQHVGWILSNTCILTGIGLATKHVLSLGSVSGATLQDLTTQTSTTFDASTSLPRGRIRSFQLATNGLPFAILRFQDSTLSNASPSYSADPLPNYFALTTEVSRGMPSQCALNFSAKRICDPTEESTIRAVHQQNEGAMQKH